MCRDTSSNVTIRLVGMVGMDGVLEPDKLLAENAELKRKIEELEQQLRFLTKHPSFIRGFSGETLVAQAVSGCRSGTTTSYDVRTSEVFIEVKMSALHWNNRVGSSTRKWAWPRVFGNSNGKQYDFLILMGDTDRRWQQRYKDTSSPYVFFCVPYNEVLPLTVDTDSARFKAINLTSNPWSISSNKAKMLYEKYQTTIDDLEKRFRF